MDYVGNANLGLTVGSDPESLESRDVYGKRHALSFGFQCLLVLLSRLTFSSIPYSNSLVSIYSSRYDLPRLLNKLQQSRSFQLAWSGCRPCSRDLPRRSGHPVLCRSAGPRLRTERSQDGKHSWKTGTAGPIGLLLFRCWCSSSFLSPVPKVVPRGCHEHGEVAFGRLRRVGTRTRGDVGDYAVLV